MTHKLLNADALTALRKLPSQKFNACITSPPYFGLRDYGTASWQGSDPACDHLGEPFRTRASINKNWGAGFSDVKNAVDRQPMGRVCSKCGAVRVDQQIGLEQSPQEYVAKLVEIFREVRRTLRDDGTLWLNLGDSYNASPPGNKNPMSKSGLNGAQTSVSYRARLEETQQRQQEHRGLIPGLKPKDLIGIPWLAARALQQPYYTGRIKDVADRAWLAGFLDGEGTISYVERDRGENHSSTHDVRVFITNCDAEPLHYFSQMTAGHVYRHDGERENRYGSRPCFRWQMGTHDGALLIRELFPYLKTKRKQALLVWTLFTTLRHQNGHARTPNSVIEKRKKLSEMIRLLNSGDNVDLPDWIETPPSPTEKGYYLRQDNIWAKPNPMPESVRDRTTRSHEYLFHFSKSEKYYYDADAIAEDAVSTTLKKFFDNSPDKQRGHGRRHEGFNGRYAERLEREGIPKKRNRRSVWTIAPQPFKEAHFATFPPALVEPCILAGSPINGFILDPFAGAGTTGLVANSLHRHCLMIELNPAYCEIINRRLSTCTTSSTPPFPRTTLDPTSSVANAATPTQAPGKPSTNAVPFT